MPRSLNGYLDIGTQIEDGTNLLELGGISMC